MTRISWLRVLLALALACVALPGAALADDLGERAAQGAGRGLSTGGGDTDADGSWDTTNPFGEGRRGVEGGRVGVDFGQPSGSIDTPATCVRGRIRLDPWSQHVPDFEIRTVPRQAGVVGVETHFWFGGEFDGRAVRDQATGWYPIYQWNYATNTCQIAQIVNVVIRIHYWPIEYRWDYGDGTSPEQHIACPDSNQPTNCELGIGDDSPRLARHVYQTTTVGEYDEGGYLVVGTVVFRMGISENYDGAPVTPLLDSFEDRAWLRYQVREVQTVLTNR